MIIEYWVNCFERTLKIEFPAGYEHLENEILEMLEEYYLEWHDAENIEDEEQRLYVLDCCLEEYMMERLSETYNMWTDWESIKEREPEQLDITKRKQFSTVGELKKLLENISDDTQITITGDPDCWFHITGNKEIICLDCEDLEEDYEE